MINPDYSYSRILSYLKGLLSNRHRHELEKEIMRDRFAVEAYDGLQSIPVEDLDSDIYQLKQQVKQRIRKDRRLPAYFTLKIAASILILIGLVIAIKFSVKQNITVNSPKKLAEKTESSVVQKQDYKSLEPIQTISKSKKVSEIKESPVNSESPTEEINIPKTKIEEQKEPIIQSLSSSAKESEKAMRKVGFEKPKSESKQVFKGKVIDSQGIPLPGVNITEKGTTNGVVSDGDGNFELKVTDHKSVLAFNYVGYQSVELATDSAKDHDIKMNEDLLALDEVVVVGYGTVKKSDLTGAIATVKTEDLNNSVDKEPEILKIEPIPPTGSYNSFKKYIYKNFNYSQFTDLAGKFKVVVEFLVYEDGSVGNFNFKLLVDQRIINEVKRIILSSGKWQPGLLGDQKTESKVRLRLIIELNKPSVKTP